MSYTPLHRELGLDGGALTIQMMDAAVAQGLEETTDLDWKRVVPSKDDSDHEEFAKDVAAMANSGGGMLVYGIAEKGKGSSAANKVMSVDEWDDGVQMRLQQVAYGWIRPPVHGLIFTPVEDGQRRVVALQVPSSRDVPHLVARRNEVVFSAPLRYGSTTQFMDERQLEAAYNTRRDQRDRDQERAERLITELLEQVDLNTSPWLVVSAVPHNPRPAHLPRPEAWPLTEIIHQAWAYNPLLISQRQAGSGAQARPGLRRWIWRDEYRGHIFSITEVHDDGSMLFATPTPPGKDMTTGDLQPLHVQRGLAQGVWLAHKVARRLDNVSDVDFRVDLRSAHSPLFLRQYDGGNLADRDQAVARFLPVFATASPHLNVRGLSQLAWDLATDVFNQAGIQGIGSPHLLKPEDAETQARS